MPVINRIADYADDMTAWRRHLHAHPEVQFACHETAKFVVRQLRVFGVDEIHEGIATSGVVAIINGRAAGPTIGLRADMDALAVISNCPQVNNPCNSGQPTAIRVIVSETPYQL